MRDNLFRGFFAVLLLLACCLTSGCDSDSSDEALRIGALAPLTGELANVGMDARASMELGLEDLQRHLNAQGFSAELVIADTGSTAEGALAAVQQLHEQGVDLVVGPASSDELAAILSYVQAEGMVVLNTSSTAPSIDGGGGVIFMSPDDSKQAEALDMMWDTHGVKRVVPVYRDDLYGQGMLGALEEKLGYGRAGDEVSLFEGVAYDPDTADMSQVAQELANKVGLAMTGFEPEEVAVCLISFEEGVDLLRAAAEQGQLGQVAWFATDGLAKSRVLIEDEEAASFAAAVELTATLTDYSVGEHPSVPATLRNHNLFAAVRNRLAVNEGDTEHLTPSSAIEVWYDAVWLSGLALESRLLDGISLMEALTQSAGRAVGYAARLEVDDQGKRVYYEYGFYKVINDNSGERETGYSWGLVASCHQKKLNLPSLFYERAFIPDGAPRRVTLGALLPLTGELASQGAVASKALAMSAADLSGYLTDFYGVGSAVLLETRDSASDPDTALAMLQELHAAGVDIVITAASSAELNAILPFAEANGMTLLSTSSTAPSLALPDNLFRMMVNDLKQAKAMALFLQNQGLDTILPVYRNDIYAQEFIQALESEFTALGGTVLSGVGYAPESTAFDVVVDEAEQAAQGLGSTAGVLLIAFDEAPQIMAEANSSPTLKALRWLGTDSTAFMAGVLNNPNALSFALATRFTASGHSFTYDDFDGVLLPYIADFQYAAADLLGVHFTQVPAIFPASYDSIWRIVSTLIAMDWAEMDQAAFGEALQDSYAIGYNALSLFDENGDALYGNIGFYTPDATTGLWKNTHICPFFYGAETAIIAMDE